MQKFDYFISQMRRENILSINEKLPPLKFPYFENYKRNLDSYFTFRISGQLQTCLEQQNHSPTPATRDCMARTQPAAAATHALCAFSQFIKI